DLRRDPSFYDQVLAVIVDGEGQTLVIGLRYRIEQLGTIAGVHPHTAPSPGPASLVVVENPKPDKAVQQIETARSEEAGEAVEMVEELAVGSDIERAEQHIGQVEWAETAIEVAHIAEDKRRVDALAPRFVSGEFDHGRAEIEPAIGVTPSMPFLEIRCGAGAQLEDPVNFRLRKFVDRGLEKIEFPNRIIGG